MIKQKKSSFSKNKTGKQFSTLVITIVLAVVFLGTVGVLAGKNGKFAAGAGPLVKVNLVGSVERNGEKMTLEEAKVVKPNEILHWTIASKNEGDGEARQYKAVGKISQGTVYVMGSAKADGSAVAKFSIDGGNEFSEKPLTEEKQADGSVKQVPAPVEMFTDVRFEWANPINSNEERNASYDVRVK
ncbi:MAG: hypothetical protein ACR2J3_04075 [Aridibacter sp.]